MAAAARPGFVRTPVSPAIHDQLVAANQRLVDVIRRKGAAMDRSDPELVPIMRELLDIRQRLAQELGVRMYDIDVNLVLIGTSRVVAVKVFVRESALPNRASRPFTTSAPEDIITTVAILPTMKDAPAPPVIPPLGFGDGNGNGPNGPPNVPGGRKNDPFLPPYGLGGGNGGNQRALQAQGPRQLNHGAIGGAPQGNDAGRLSTGAIVGIVVGSISGLILFILLILFLIRRNRKRSIVSNDEQKPTQV